MSFIGTIEADTGDRLLLVASNGQIVGNALVAFLGALSQYCLQNEVPMDIKGWFSRIESYSTAPICILSKAFYSGDWEYSANEYEWFLQRSPLMEMSETDFRQTIADVREKWQDAEVLITCVTELSAILQNYDFETTWWFDQQNTIEELLVLCSTLSLLIKRGAKQARIKFT